MRSADRVAAPACSQDSGQYRVELATALGNLVFTENADSAQVAVTIEGGDLCRREILRIPIPARVKAKIALDRAQFLARRCHLEIVHISKEHNCKLSATAHDFLEQSCAVAESLQYFPALKDTSEFIGLYLGPKNEVKKNGKWMFLNLLSIWSESGEGY